MVKRNKARLRRQRLANEQREADRKTDEFLDKLLDQLDKDES